MSAKCPAREHLNYLRVMGGELGFARDRAPLRLLRVARPPSSGRRLRTRRRGRLRAFCGVCVPINFPFSLLLAACLTAAFARAVSPLQRLGDPGGMYSHRASLTPRPPRRPLLHTAQLPRPFSEQVRQHPGVTHGTSCLNR